jgi:hypothetical protein
MQSLEMYNIKPSQTLTQYIWIVELVFDACATIRGFVWTSEEKVRILVKGIHLDSRFKPFCDSVLLLDRVPAYDVLKMKALRIEKIKLLERTSRATLEKSLSRLRNPKSDKSTDKASVHHSNTSGGGGGSRSSSPKDRGKKKYKGKSNNRNNYQNNDNNGNNNGGNNNNNSNNSSPKDNKNYNNSNSNNNKGGKNMNNVNTTSSKDVHDNYVKNSNEGKSGKVNHSRATSYDDVSFNGSILSNIHYADSDEDNNGYGLAKINMFRARPIYSPPETDENGNAIHQLEVGQIRHLLREFPHIQVSIIEIFNYLDGTGNRGVESSGAVWVRLKECGSRSIVPFPATPGVEPVRPLEVLVQAKHKDESFTRDLTYIHHHIKSYLTITADNKLFHYQKVRLALEDRSRKVIYHVKGRISDICEEAFHHPNVRNFVLRNCAKCLEDAVNEHSETHQFRICHLKPKFEELEEPTRAIYYIRCCLLPARFWVISSDYYFIEQTIWCLCIADMCPALRDVIYRVIGSITIKYEPDLMQYIGIHYETTIKLENVLVNYARVCTLDKAELIRNMTRLTELFNLDSDLYYRVWNISTHPQPSVHLYALFGNFIMHISDWFSTMCALRGFNLRPFVGDEFHQILNFENVRSLRLHNLRNYAYNQHWPLQVRMYDLTWFTEVIPVVVTQQFQSIDDNSSPMVTGADESVPDSIQLTQDVDLVVQSLFSVDPNSDSLSYGDIHPVQRPTVSSGPAAMFVDPVNTILFNNGDTGFVNMFQTVCHVRKQRNGIRIEELRSTCSTMFHLVVLV